MTHEENSTIIVKNKKNKPLIIGLSSIGIIGALAGGYAYADYNSAYNQFARNEIKQMTIANNYFKERTKLSTQYGEKAKDKKQELEVSFGKENDKTNINIYKDPKSKNASIEGKSKILNKEVSGIVSEKDEKLGIDLNFYNKSVEVPSKAITEYFKEVSEGKADEINLSLNDLVESFFFTSDNKQLTEDQVKNIYKSIDKKAFTKEGNAIILKLDRDRLIKLAEAFKKEMKANNSDNKINEMTLDNLINQAKNYNGVITIKQEKQYDTTLSREITTDDNHVLKITTTVVNSKVEAEIEVKDKNSSVNSKVNLISEKNGDNYKENILATNEYTPFESEETKKTEVAVELKTEKVSDTEYKLDGTYTNTNIDGAKDSIHLKGTAKIEDNSLVYKVSAQDIDFMFKYTYDVEVKEIDSSKEKVIIENFNDPVFSKTLVEIQQELTKYFLAE